MDHLTAGLCLYKGYMKIIWRLCWVYMGLYRGYMGCLGFEEVRV